MFVENDNESLRFRIHSRSAKWRMTFIVTISILFCALLTQLVLEHYRSQRNQDHLFATSTRILQQCLLELSRLETAVLEYTMDPTVTRARQAQLRFEIFWSRTNLLTEGYESSQLWQFAIAERVQTIFIDAISKLEPLLVNLPDLTTFERISISEKLATLWPALHQASQDLNDKRIAQSVKNDVEQKRFTFLIFGAFLLSAVLIILTAIVQTVRNERLVENMGQMMASLKSHVQNIRNLTEVSPSGILIFEADGQVRYVNDTFSTLQEQLSCRSSIETLQRIVGHSILSDRNLAYGFQRKSTIHLIKSTDNSERAFRVHWADMQWYGRPSRLALVQELTEMRNAEQKAGRAARLAALAELSTAVAHEINQPLTILGSSAQNIIRRIRSNRAEFDEVANKLMLILDQVDRVRTITDRMRVLGNVSDEPTSPVSLVDCIQSSTSLVTTTFGEAGIRIDLGLPPDHQAMTNGKRGIIEHVFLALLLNARDAFASCPSTAKSDKRIKVSLKGDADFWLITIADTAGGFEESIIDRVFEPFVTTKTRWQNLGLGLHFCYSAIKELSGARIPRVAG